MTHDLKIERCFADAILSGEKTFEIRKNDRGFQKGDTIQFFIHDDALPGVSPWHDIRDKKYKITYVLSGWGLEPGYVALAIRPFNKEEL